MSPVPSLPNPLRDGIDVARGSEVYANDQALLDVLDHGIDFENLAANPNFPGTCISSTPGSRLPESRIEDDAVTFDKLRDDATVDANRTVGTNHIRNLSVTKAKLSLTAGQKISAEQLELTVQSIPFNITVWTQLTSILSPGGPANGLRMVGVDVWLDAGNYKFTVRVEVTFSNAIYHGSKNDFALTTALPVATTMIVGAYVLSPSYTPTTFSGTLVVTSLPLS